MDAGVIIIFYRYREIVRCPGIIEWCTAGSTRGVDGTNRILVIVKSIVRDCRVRPSPTEGIRPLIIMVVSVNDEINVVL